MTTGVLEQVADGDAARPGPIRRFTRWLGTPPRLPFHGLCLAATVGLLWAASVPGGVLGWTFGSLLALLGLACIWFVRTVAALFTRQVLWWHLVAPVGLVLVTALLWVDAPVHARWWLSAGAFDGAVAEYADAFDEPRRQYVSTDRWIGAYRVDGVSELRNGGLVFSAADSGIVFDSGYFYYLPDGSTPRDFRDERDQAVRVTDLGDGWFAVVESW